MDPPVNSTTKLYSNANATPVLTSLPKPPISTTNAAYSYVSNATYYALTAENDGQAYHVRPISQTVLHGFQFPEASTASYAQLSVLPHQVLSEYHSPHTYIHKRRLFQLMCQALMTSDTAVQEEGTLPTVSSQPEYLAAPNAAPAAGPAEIIEIIEAIPVPTPNVGPFLEISAAPNSGPASGPAAGPIEAF